MRVFARFDNNNICVGYIITSDPSFAHDNPEYEQVTDPQEQSMVVAGLCKKVLTEAGQRMIVLL